MPNPQIYATLLSIVAAVHVCPHALGSIQCYNRIWVMTELNPYSHREERYEVRLVLAIACFGAKSSENGWFVKAVSAT